MYYEYGIDIKGLDDWEVSLVKVVGGFIWLGFSEQEPHKMLCISADKETIFDCEKGTVSPTKCVFDENERTAVCAELKDEIINICGQYGGELPHKTAQGEKLSSVKREEFKYGKTLVREEVTFTVKNGSSFLVYEGYAPYIYGFSPDGNYFVFATDGGLTVLKRKQ